LSARMYPEEPRLFIYVMEGIIEMGKAEEAKREEELNKVEEIIKKKEDPLIQRIN